MKSKTLTKYSAFFFNTIAGIYSVNSVQILSTS